MSDLYIDREILKGLKKIPTPTTPGSIVVTGKSQAVFTGPNPGDVILAAAKYGNGKVLVAAHDCYLNWLYQENEGVKKSFMNNVREWLCGPSLDDSEILDLDVEDDQDFSGYRLIKWRHDTDISSVKQQNLLSFIENGGALFCGSTPWGYLQIYSNRNLSDMVMFNFLKDFFGIIFTSSYLHFPNEETDVNVNQAKISNFDQAIEKVILNPNKIEKYMNTIQCGLDILYKEGVVDDLKICNIKDCVENHCQEKSMNLIPNELKPIRNLNEMNALKLIGKCLFFTNESQAPGIESFPGIFHQDPDLKQEVHFDFQTKFSERLSTGYYLPAGVTLLINSKSGSNINDWSILIGCHSDDLSGCDEFKRWPCVTVQKQLLFDFNLLSSPFGGLIYLVSPENGGEINIVLSNIVESPYFDLLRPETRNDWNRRKDADGIWAELAGRYIIFSTPSKCVRHLSVDQCSEVLDFWDKVVLTHHELRGTNVNDYRRERVVNDMQPSAGYMHSGYPIVTHLDCCQNEYEECIFDAKKLKEKGCWGLFHELGHNMQRDEWTFDGSTEVTVNLFSMHAFHLLVGKKVPNQKWLLDQRASFKKFFSKQPTYHDWQNDYGMALATFAQLIKHFGWQPMYKFMKEYEADIRNQNDLPHSNQEKIDQWVLRYSRILKRNIKPQFQMFGLPVSERCDHELALYQSWIVEGEKNPDKFFN